MMNQWKQVLPTKFVVLVFAVLYVLTYRLDYWFIRLGAEVPPEVRFVRLPLLVGASVFYGLYRARAFHPFYNRHYLRCLSLTPWTFGKPLPLGPIHLIWVDLLVMSILTLLAHIEGVFHPALPALAFLAVYLTLLAVSLQGEQIAFLVAYIVLVPFAIYPHRNASVALVVSVGIYVVLYFGLREQLKGFPWNTGYWKSDPIEQFSKQAVSRGIIGWPARMLRAYEPSISCDVPDALFTSVVVTWWLHVIRWVVDKPYDLGLLALITMFVFLARLLAYRVGGYWPPITFLGRVFTLRWIIPGHDKIYAAPICIILASVGTVHAADALGLGPIWQFELAVFFMVFLALSLPPTLKDWRLTGQHRIAHVAGPRRQQEAAAPFAGLFEQPFSAKVRKSK
ncbi:MAG: hypothetical protein ACYTEL_03540 [Planctomycetota bacterium]|jgi:hypothetical protein